MLFAAGWALYGCWQLSDRKEIQKVDRDLMALGFVFALTLILYVVFAKIGINYRPVLEDGYLEPSFPSSHTLLAVVVFGCSLAECERRMMKGTKKAVIERSSYGCFCLLLEIVIGRLLSGVHWLTDILGGILIGTAIVEMFKGIVEKYD